MKWLFSYCWIKCFFVFIVAIFSSLPSFSQEVENELTEAMNLAMSDCCEKAIPVLKKYSDSLELGEIKHLETNTLLNHCYVLTNNTHSNIDGLNELANSYLEKFKSLPKEDFISVLFVLSAINHHDGNEEKRISYLTLIKNIFEDENLDKKDGVYFEALVQLIDGFNIIEDYESAIELGLNALKLDIESDQYIGDSFILIHDYLYYAFTGINEDQESISYLKKAVEIRKEKLGEKHPDYLRSMNELAFNYFKIGDLESALKIHQQIVEIGKDVFKKTHPNYITSLNNLAAAYFELGDYSSALIINKQVVESTKQALGETHPEFVTSLKKLASTYFELGDFESVKVIYQQIVEIENGNLGELHPNFLMSLSKLAATFSDLGEYHSALKINQQIVEYTKNVYGDKHPEYLVSLNNLGSSYYSLQNYVKALELFLIVLELGSEVYDETDPNYLISLNNLANTYSQLGDYKKAYLINQQVFEKWNTVVDENNPDYLNSLSNLAFSNYNLGNYKIKALRMGREVVEKQKSNLEITNPNFTESLSNLALFYSGLGFNEEALKLILNTLELQKSKLGETHPSYIQSLNRLSNIYFQLGDFHSSFKTISRVITAEKDLYGYRHPGHEISLFSLSSAEFRLQKYNSAAVHLFQSISFIQQRIIEYFGQLTAYQRENYWYSKDQYFQAIPLFIENIIGFQNEYLDNSYDIALFTKGLLLNTTLDFEELIAENGSSDAVEKYQDLKLLKLQIQRLYERPISERYLDVDSLETAAQRLETDLVKISKEYGDYTQNLKVNWKDVQAKLGENDLAIEFLEYPTLTDTVKYAALLLRKSWENPKFVPLFRKDQVDEFLNLDKDQIYSFDTVGIELKKLVWGPLEKYVLPGDRVYFAASGILHQLAIENLAYDETTTLGDQYQMFRLSSTKELVLQKENEASPTVALYGGIKYDLEIDQMIVESEKYQVKGSYFAIRGIPQDSVLRKGWQFLPGTLVEAEEISGILSDNHYKVGKYLGEIGSEESFKALSGKKTGIIHIATHGFFLPIEISKKNRFLQMRMEGQAENTGYMDPMLRAGLMLAGGNMAWQGDSIPDTIEDGILTAKEISHLDLRETDLVVLSACETGLGDVSSEGVFGLQRAFKQAGVQTIIMSLWNVKDEATQQLMTNFYENLMKGSSKREAFVKARNQCRESYPDPAYWAAFIMLD